MAFHHRKLLYEPLSDLFSICEPYCDDVLKSNGSCPLSCFNICPPYSCKQVTSLFPPPPPPLPPPPVSPTIILPKPPNVSLLLTASLAVLATAFFIFACYTIYRFYSVWRKSRRPQQRRRPPEEHGGPDQDLLDEDEEPVVDHPIWYIRTIGLQPSVINAITIVKYKRADGLVEGSDCAVCLSEFEEDETLRLLPKCSHAFHIPCIDTWLASHTNCPLCRAGIVSNAAEEPAAHDSGRAEEAENEGDGSGRSQIGPGVSENVEGGGDLKVDAGGLETIEMGLDGVQGVRRSVSMDSVSASMISAAVANGNLCDKNGREKHKEWCKDEEEVGMRSVQTGSSSISIKRSASCSAKLFLSRHSSRMNRS